MKITDMTVNFRTSDYIVKSAKASGSSSAVYVPIDLIGVDVVCVDLVSPDFLIIEDVDDDNHIISCCANEMIKRTVKPKIGNGLRTGVVRLPVSFLGDDILIIPLE